MNHAISTELQFFLISIIWGTIILLAYDVLRILRRIIKHSSIILAIEDIIFWIVTSVFIFAMMYTLNNGIIRGFSIMGVSIGMVLYHYLLSELVVGIITKLIQLLLTPFNLAIKMVKRCFHFVLLRGKKIVNFITRRLKKHSKSFKMKINVRRQALDVKRKKKLEEKALAKKKKDEIILAKQKAKADLREKKGKNRSSVAKNKSDKRKNSETTSRAQQNLTSENRLTVDKSIRPEPRRVAKLVFESTKGNKVGQHRRSDLK